MDRLRPWKKKNLLQTGPTDQSSPSFAANVPLVAGTGSSYFEVLAGKSSSAYSSYSAQPVLASIYNYDQQSQQFHQQQQSQQQQPAYGTSSNVPVYIQPSASNYLPGQYQTMAAASASFNPEPLGYIGSLGSSLSLTLSVYPTDPSPPPVPSSSGKNPPETDISRPAFTQPSSRDTAPEPDRPRRATVNNPRNDDTASGHTTVAHDNTPRTSSHTAFRGPPRGFQPQQLDPYSTLQSVPGDHNAENEVEEGHEENGHTCEMCAVANDGAILHFCDMCESTYCDRCWDSIPPHKSKGRVHEKTKHGIAKKVREALSPPSDEASQEQRFNSDAMTAWFGLSPCLQQSTP
jgi:hypothetical protein